MDNERRRGTERTVNGTDEIQKRGKLVLTRRKSETVIIGGNIRVTVERLERNKVALSFRAPKEVVIAREEVLHEGKGKKPQEAGPDDES